jgi:CBS domain-containing protein
MNVSEIMNKVMVAKGEMSLREAARIMSTKGIGCLVIVKGEKILGIVTERDVMKNMGGLGRKVSSAMSKSVVTIDEHESLDSAASLMTAHKVKRLPVTYKGKLVGIITATDLVANSDLLNENFLLG